MTIRSKLTLNVASVLALVVTVSVTSIVGLRFVKARLQYLTERTTPFQMQTLELQGALQAAAAALTRAGAASTQEGYAASRAAAEQALKAAKEAQSRLDSLSLSRSDASGSLDEVAGRLFDATSSRLGAEEAAAAANATVNQRLAEASGKLRGLDSSIRKLQAARSEAFNASAKDSSAVLARLRSIESLRMSLKDLQMAIGEMQRATDKKPLLVAGGKASTAKKKAMQNEYVAATPALAADLKTLESYLDEFVKVRGATLGQADEGAKARYDEVNGNLRERLSATLLSIEQEIVSANDAYNKEAANQTGIFGQATTATSVLTGTSELLALGFSVEGLASRLASLASAQEVEGTAKELQGAFQRMDRVEKELQARLAALHAQKEAGILVGVTQALRSIQGLLLGEEGIVQKRRRVIEMRALSQSAAVSLAEIVRKAAKKGSETVLAAREEQTKSVTAVNRVVSLGSLAIGLIGAFAVVFGAAFGAWIYRSVSTPVKNASLGLASNAEQLSATAKSLKSGSRRQAQQIEDASVSINEMSKSVAGAAENAAQAAGAAERMKAAALQGKESMDSTAAELLQFAAALKESARCVEQLGAKSQEVGGIVAMIKTIAHQTNLLALNAAVEAARAGEVGKGFAVVAENVRDLASRTSQAAADISKTLETMQSEVESAITRMKKETSSIERVSEKVDGTLGAVGGISRLAEEVTDMVQQIAAATQEQSAASEEISERMQDVGAVTRDLAGAVDAIRRVSHDLGGLVVGLQEMAGWRGSAKS